MLTGVYRILNLRNGKAYVGSASKSVAVRFWTHRKLLVAGKHHSKHLQCAWNFYGAKAFRFETLEVCPPEQCLTREQYWIDTLEVCDRRKGYNKSPTAGSPKGVKHSDETRKKVSEALKGRKKTASHAASIKAGKQNVTPATRKKMSEYAKSRTPKHLANLSKSMKGKQNCLGRVLSEETKKLLAERTRERWARWKREGRLGRKKEW